MELELNIWTTEFYKSIRPVVNSIGLFNTPKALVSSSFNRIQSDFDLWYITAGKGSVKIDHEWIDFQQGDLVTIKPGENYQQEKAAADSTFSNYALHLSLFPATDKRFEQQLKSIFPRKLALTYQPNSETIFEKLLEFHTFKQANNLLLQKSLVYSLLDMIFELIRHEKVKNISANHRQVVKVKDYIEQHYAKDISLREMATTAGLSFTHFSKLFKLYFNISPTNYHIDYRLKMAKLFLSKGYSVTTTSEKCGFHSIHYFSRLFKRRLGISPVIFVATYIRK